MTLDDEGSTEVVEPDAGCCVLVVEDDPYQRRVIVKILRSWGHVTIEAADGGMALERAQEAGDQLDVVLLDIMLPVLDGVEVARRLRRQRPDLPIVASSAVSDEEIEAELKRMGVRSFLPKPYSAETLRTVVRQATC